MPRRTPVREIQSEEAVGSPLRRSSRISNASPVPTSAPTKVLSRRNSATEIPSASTPTRVTRSRRSSFSLEQEKAEDVDKKAAKTTRTRRASLTQNEDNQTEEETTTKRKARGSSVTKEQVTEVKKPATRRRKSVSEDEEKVDENETAKRSTRSRSGSFTKKTDREDLKRKANSESIENVASPIKKASESAKILEPIEEANKEGDSPQNKIAVVRMKRIEVAKVDLDLSVINETSLTEEEEEEEEEDSNSASQHKEETEDVDNVSKEKEPEVASEKAPEREKTLDSIEEVNKESDSPQTKIPIVRMERIEVAKVDLHKEETEDVDISKEKEPALSSKKDEKTENADSSKLENTKFNEEKLDIVEKSSVIKENPAAVRKDAEIDDESLSETSFQLQLSQSINETSFTHEIKENSPSNKENVSPQKKAAFVETECEPMEVDISLSSISSSPVKSHRKSLSKSLNLDDVGKELEFAAKVTDEIANFLTEEIKFTGKNPSVTSKLHESTEDINSTGEKRRHSRLSLKKNQESVSPKVNGFSEDKSVKPVTEKNEEASKEMLQLLSVTSPTRSEEKKEKVPSEKTDVELESVEEPENGDDDTASILGAKPSEIENYSQEESPKKIVSPSMDHQESKILSQATGKDNEDIVNEESESSSAVEGENEVEYASPIEELGDSDEEPLQEEEMEETEKEVENSSSTILPNDSTVNESPEKQESPQIEKEEISQEIQTSSPTKSLSQSIVEESPEEIIDSLKEQVPEGEETKRQLMKGIKEIHELPVTQEPCATVQEPKSSQEETTIEATIRESEDASIESLSPTKSLNESNAAESLINDEQITKEQVKETEEIQELSPEKSQKNEVEEPVTQPEKKTSVEGTTTEDSDVEVTNNAEKEDIEDISTVELNDIEDDVSTQGNESTMDDDDEEEEETSIMYSTSEAEAVVEESQTDEERIVDKKITDSKKSQIEKDKSTPEIVILSEDEKDNNRESKSEDAKGKTPEKEDKVITSNQRRSSFTMQENLKAGEGKSLREQIHKVVDMFCAGIKDKDVKLNVSLEYTGQFSDDSETSKNDVFEVSLAAIAAEDQETDKAPRNEKGSKRRKICHKEEQQLMNEDSPSKDTTENEEFAQISLSESKKKKKKRKAVSIELEEVSSPTIADISPSKKQKKHPNTPYKTPNSKEKAPTSGEEEEEDVNINEQNHEQVVPRSGRNEKRKSNSFEETNSPCHYDFENLPSYLQTSDEGKEFDVTWAPSEDEETESSDSSTKELNETTELKEDLEKLNEGLDEQSSDIENRIKKHNSKSSASVKLSFSGEDTSDCVFDEENEDEKSNQKGKKKRKLFHLSDYDISKAMKMDLETSTETKDEQKSIKKKKNKVSKESASVKENDLPQTSEHVKDNDKNVKKKKKKTRKDQNITSSTSEDEDVADAQEFDPDILFAKKLPAQDVEVDTNYFKPSVITGKKKAKLSKIKPSAAAGTSEWDVQIIS